MKKILFLVAFLFTFIEISNAQNYYIKEYNPAFLNKPRISGMEDSMAVRGQHVISDSILLDEILCYMDVLQRKYYSNTVIRYKDGRLKYDVLNESTVKLTDLRFIFYADLGTDTVVMERLYVYFNIPSFGYGYFSQNTETANGKKTLELYLVLKEYGHGQYNLTTGKRILGEDRCWVAFNALDGFQYLLMDLEWMDSWDSSTN